MSAVRTEGHGHVRVVTLDRPERRNALLLEGRLKLLDALRAAGRRPRGKDHRPTGAGVVFCVGGDLASMSPRAA